MEYNKENKKVSLTSDMRLKKKLKVNWAPYTVRIRYFEKDESKGIPFTEVVEAIPTFYKEDKNLVKELKKGRVATKGPKTIPQKYIDRITHQGGPYTVRAMKILSQLAKEENLRKKTTRAKHSTDFKLVSGRKHPPSCTITMPKEEIISAGNGVDFFENSSQIGVEVKTSAESAPDFPVEIPGIGAEVNEITSSEVFFFDGVGAEVTI